MSNLLISVPTEVHGTVSVHLADWMMRVLVDPRRLGPTWSVRWDFVQDKPTAQTRNRQCRRFLDSDNDYVLFLDSDMVPSDEAIASMLASIKREDIEVITGIADRFTPMGPMPVIHRYTDDFTGATLHNEILSRDPNEGPFKLENAGTGAAILLCSRYALMRIEEEQRVWFKDVLCEERGHEKFGHRVIGHDSWFFIQCHELGIPVWVDTTAYIGHVKPGDLSVQAAHFHRERIAKERAEAELERIKGAGAPVTP